ncbi:50S ribosomal protein L18 [Candidatus Dependentiae bacterium]|nr:50S ribosomal protein L18 [Candidatus Dependentiae bacterium]
MSIQRKVALRRVRRAFRVRNSLRGSHPRVSVFKSNRHISAQVINDADGKTIVSFSSVALKSSCANKDIAKQVGLELGKLALQASVSKVCFDRGSNLYHGRVQALADGLRESGLVF